MQRFLSPRRRKEKRMKLRTGIRYLKPWLCPCVISLITQSHVVTPLGWGLVASPCPAVCFSSLSLFHTPDYIPLVHVVYSLQPMFQFRSNAMLRHVTAVALFLASLVLVLGSLFFLLFSFTLINGPTRRSWTLCSGIWLFLYWTFSPGITAG